MSINIGNLDIKDFKFGNKQNVSKVYLGNVEIWAAPEIPVVLDNFTLEDDGVMSYAITSLTIQRGQ